MPTADTSPLFRRVDATSLAVFRIGFGALLVCEMLRWLLTDRIVEHFLKPTVRFSFVGLEWLTPWPGNGMYWHFGVLAVAALGIMLGCFYRVCMTVFFLGFSWFFLLDYANYQNDYYLTCLLTGLMIFVPAHRRWSLDARFRAAIASDTVPWWALWSVRFQFAVVYIFSGIAKVDGQWFWGEPMRGRLILNLDWAFVHQLWVAQAMTLGAMALLLFAVPCLLWRRTRIPAFLLLASFHTLNWFIFGLTFVPWLMILGNTLFFPPNWARYLRRRPDAVPTGTSSEAATDTVVHEAQVSTSSFARRAVPAGLALFIVYNLVMPLRHWCYPGHVDWTEEGSRFAWRMMAGNREAFYPRFIVMSPAAGRRWDINPIDELTMAQTNAMASSAELIHQYALHLAGGKRAEGFDDVAVHALVEVSYNGRRSIPLIDPSVNLAAQPRDIIRPTPWIVRDLPARMDHRRVDGQRHRRTPWAGFPPGASVTLERKLIRGDAVSRPQQKRIVLRTYDKDVPALSVVMGGELSPAKRATLGNVPLTLPLREVRREPATLTVAGRTIACEAVYYERMEPGSWRGNLTIWYAHEALAPYRELITTIGTMALESNVVRLDFQFEEVALKAHYASELVSLGETVRVGDLDLSCAVERQITETQSMGHQSRVTAVYHLNSTVPGHLVRVVTEPAGPAGEAREIVELVDFSPRLFSP